MSRPTVALAHITGYGITTAVGGNTAQSCAALRAGIARFAPTDRHLCFGADPEAEDLEEPIVAPVDRLDPACSGNDRLLGLALPALAEAVRLAGLRRSDLAAASLHLALPQRSRPGPENLERIVPAELVRRAALPDPRSGTVTRSGHAGFAKAASAAVVSLRNGDCDTALVVCVDSLVGSAALRWLDAADRLKCTRSPEGVVAGEAAAALVLRRGEPGRPPPAGARAVVEAIGLGRETATITSEEVCVGAGLTAAIRAAAAGVAAPPSPPWVVLDHAGERYRAAEWGYVIMRLHEYFRDLHASWLLADCLGDVGAAFGGVAAARVIAAFERGYAPADRAWLIMGSDDGDRGAVIIGRPDPGGA